MQRAALYLRLSRKDEEKQANQNSESIENQRMLLLDYINQHHMIAVKEYVDENYSGLTDCRPGFRQLLADAEDKMFDVVVAKDQSRFSRNMQHIEKYLHREFKRYGIRFIGITDGTDTDDQMNKKARQIYALVNEWYSEDLSESVRAVLSEKVKNGQFIGSFAPYGYQKDKTDKHKLCVKQDEAEIVKKIFEYYVNGSSLRGICRILDMQQIRTPTGKLHWNPVTVKRILTNEVYLGHLQQRKSTNCSYKDRKRIYFDKENWVIHRDVHEPIISSALFFMVQKRLHGWM